MDLWNNKVTVVTGASAGIGAEICRELCKFNVIVVGLARRVDRLEELQKNIQSTQKDAQFHFYQCDVTKEEDIQRAFEFVLTKFKGVDILINNAGIFHNSSFFDGDNLMGLKKVIETNLVALISCTKKAFACMIERDCPGYIINVSSTSGHVVPVERTKPIVNVYPATKHALSALVQTLRHELNYLKNKKIRISNISPGCVRTEITVAAGLSMDNYSDWPLLETEDISKTVIFMLATDPRVQIQDIIIRPTGELY